MSGKNTKKSTDDGPCSSSAKKPSQSHKRTAENRLSAVEPRAPPKSVKTIKESGQDKKQASASAAALALNSASISSISHGSTHMKRSAGKTAMKKSNERSFKLYALTNCIQDNKIK